jgi:hypothetical protein
MQTIGNTQPVASEPKEQQKSNEVKKPTGFQLHPENINRKGYIPREWTWKSEIEKAVEESTKDGKTIKYHLIRALLKKGLSGDTKAMEIVMDRMDGKALQPIDHTTQGEKIPGPMVYIPEEK